MLLAFTILVLTACTDSPSPQTQTCPEIPAGTKSISGATFIMGFSPQYLEEETREVSVEDFNIDTHEVTNKQFSEFVKATGYVTEAEKPQAGFDKPGAAVFTPPSAKHPNWWRFVEGANWQHPEGPQSSIQGQDNYPVVQVSFLDALSYAQWAGRDLPTEAEWEYAANANAATKFVWGDERAPGGREMANTWQGAFPVQNTQKDGFALRAPVGCFPANGFGLYDMIGNVWEWTKSDAPRASPTSTSVIKGGSFLCAENYCARYRSGARQFQERDLSTNHIGFRTVSRR